MYIKMIYHLPGTNNKIIICAKDFSFLINFYSVNTTIASFSVYGINLPGAKIPRVIKEKGDQNEFWKKSMYLPHKFITPLRIKSNCYSKYMSFKAGISFVECHTKHISVLHR
ncbi:unnamed protein product [Rhizophagus irregularis]|uniref:Uncharacterized protein n=1 Tax=Rhizophagus irregularis TaxID=588596 RepID=A0A915Z4K1_9GLOM|nr:unnamed protein product [Rhizophagus irregularis]CAB5362368.1 unnamed protein product [Rhizophagus irregularis]